MVLVTRLLSYHRDGERVVTWQGGRDRETKQAGTMWKTTSRLIPLHPCGSNPRKSKSICLMGELCMSTFPAICIGFEANQNGRF